MFKYLINYVCLYYLFIAPIQIINQECLKLHKRGTSLVVQWLRLHPPNAGHPSPLVRELDPTRCNSIIPAAAREATHCNEDPAQRKEIHSQSKMA